MAEWPNVVTRTLSQWLNSNPFIPKGIRCIVSDEGRVKIGTGVRFNDTPYLSQESILRKTHRNENARYFLPTISELHKACRYDPAKGGPGVPGYWNYGTQSDEIPGLATIDEYGVGQMTDSDNTANWGGASNWAKDPYSRSYSDVGTNGAPSHYGVYDVDGQAFTICEGFGGTLAPPEAGNDPTKNIGANGSIHTNPVAWDGQYSSHHMWNANAMSFKFNTWGMRIASISNPDKLPNLVAVGDTGNPAQSKGVSSAYFEGYGSVDYEYQISKFHVTHTEYAEFLNAIGATDEHDVYGEVFSGNGEGRGSGTLNGIRRLGSQGNYYYEVMDHWANKPSGYLNFVTAARYCNWLHNGKPSGPQIAATTEDGAYTLNGTLTTSVARNSA